MYTQSFYIQAHSQHCRRHRPPYQNKITLLKVATQKGSKQRSPHVNEHAWEKKVNVSAFIDYQFMNS